GPATVGVHVYVQLSRPAAGCHVAPPSMETSTPPIAPVTMELRSDAVPVIVTGTPLVATNPAAGDVTADTGAIVSSDASAATRSDCRAPGCTPMSASRFTVAWRMRVSDGV